MEQGYRNRAQLLIETSGLDVTPAETLSALAPQMSSPPENDLQNNKGFVEPTGKKYIEDGWVKQYSPQSTQLRNATQSPAGYVDQNTNSNPYSGSTVRDESLYRNRSHYIILSIYEFVPGTPSQQMSMSSPRPSTTAARPAGFLQQHGKKLLGGALAAGGAYAAYKGFGGGAGGGSGTVQAAGQHLQQVLPVGGTGGTGGAVAQQASTSNVSVPPHGAGQHTGAHDTNAVQGGSQPGESGFETRARQVHGQVRQWIDRSRQFLTGLSSRSDEITRNLQQATDSALNTVTGVGKAARGVGDAYTNAVQGVMDAQKK